MEGHAAFMSFATLSSIRLCRWWRHAILQWRQWLMTASSLVKLPFDRSQPRKARTVDTSTSLSTRLASSTGSCLSASFSGSSSSQNLSHVRIRHTVARPLLGVAELRGEVIPCPRSPCVGDRALRRPFVGEHGGPLIGLSRVTVEAHGATRFDLARGQVGREETRRPH